MEIQKSIPDKNERILIMGFRKRVVITAFLCAITGFVLSFINIVLAQVILPYKNPDLPVEARIKDLMSRMTIKEKLVQLADQYPNANIRLGIPNLKGASMIHGVTLAYATSFPVPLAMGSTWDPDLIERMGTVVANESRALGVQHGYEPMVSVLIDPRWGRSEECFGEDPYHVSRISVGFVHGLQGRGEERFDENHIIATAKHFVADGQPIGGINATAMDVSIRRLHEVFLPPYKAVVEEAGVGCIMAAHHSLNGIPCHANKYILQTVLRDTYGFDGHVISDNMDISRLYTNKLVAENFIDAARLALEAGVDQEMAIDRPWDDRVYGAPLLEGIENGSIPVEVLDRAVRNVLRTKFKIGLLDNNETIYPWQDHWVSGDEGFGPIEGYPEYQEVENTKAVRGLDVVLNEWFNTLHRLAVPRENWRDVLFNKEHDQLALEVAKKAITLLKNEGDLLPLDKNRLKKIAVIGPNADVEVLGAYSTPKTRHFVTVLDGIKDYVENDAEVLYKEGCSLTDMSRENIDDAVELANSSDVAILVIGGNELTAKEGEDSDTIHLTGYQQDLVKAVYATGTPVVVMLLHGRPLAIPWIADNIPAILDGWYLGQETGTAVAEAIFGEINPGGKLPVSIPRNTGQIPAYYYKTLGGARGQNMRDFIWNYRDNQAGPLFPFGHGLSYTTFEYSNLKISAISPTSAEVTVDITNTGNRERG